jgi:hypothetical protein
LVITTKPVGVVELLLDVELVPVLEPELETVSPTLLLTEATVPPTLAFSTVPSTAV